MGLGGPSTHAAKQVRFRQLYDRLHQTRSFLGVFVANSNICDRTNLVKTLNVFISIYFSCLHYFNFFKVLIYFNSVYVSVAKWLTIIWLAEIHSVS